MSDQADEEEQEKHFFTFADPALRRHSPHALTQLRLARTHDRIEIELEIDFPVRGVSLKGILTPPNLRYTSRFYPHRVLCVDCLFLLTLHISNMCMPASSPHCPS